MNFNSAFNRPDPIETPSGTPLQPTYSYRIDKKTGKRQLVQTGETNIYEKIQANLESSKLENIVKKCTNGDLSSLNIREGNYIDISEIPTNLIEIQNTILKAHDQFNELPSEIRSKFDNSVEKYVSSIGSEEWAIALGYKKNEPSAVAEEVKQEENNGTDV